MIACNRGNIHLTVFAHMRSYYSRVTIAWGVASIQINTVTYILVSVVTPYYLQCLFIGKLLSFTHLLSTLQCMDTIPSYKI